MALINATQFGTFVADNIQVQTIGTDLLEDAELNVLSSRFTLPPTSNVLLGGLKGQQNSFVIAAGSTQSISSSLQFKYASAETETASTASLVRGVTGSFCLQDTGTTGGYASLLTQGMHVVATDASNANTPSDFVLSSQYGQLVLEHSSLGPVMTYAPPSAGLLGTQGTTSGMTIEQSLSLSQATCATMIYIGTTRQWRLVPTAGALQVQYGTTGVYTNV